MTEQFDKLKKALENGSFHHATYRNIGTLWEGLHVYIKDDAGFRGYSHHTIVTKNNPDLGAAQEMVRGTGVSLGSYGNG